MGLPEFDKIDLDLGLARSCPQGGRQIEKASPIDRRSTKSRSSRLRKRSNEMTQGMQDALRNMYKTCWKYAGNGTKMNENRCPEASKEQVGGRTQCAEQRWQYLQNVPKFIENRGLEGSTKIKENRDLEGSSGSSWHVWRVSVRIFDEVGHQMCEVGAKLGPRWSIMASRWTLELNLGGLGGILGLSWWILEGSWEVLGRILEAFWDMGGLAKTYGFPSGF